VKSNKEVGLRFHAAKLFSGGALLFPPTTHPFSVLPKTQMTLSATTRITTLSLRANARAFSTSFARSIGPWGDSLPSKKLNKYIIVAEDHTDSSALARRLEVRERHLEGAAKGKQVGRVGE